MSPNLESKTATRNMKERALKRRKHEGKEREQRTAVREAIRGGVIDRHRVTACPREAIPTTLHVRIAAIDGSEDEG